VSLKGPLRRLEAGVRWLETEGRFVRIEAMMKILEMTQEIADRRAVDPAFAARWDKDFSFPLPPPRVSARPPAPKREAAPPERAPERASVIVSQTPPSPKVEPPPPAIEVRAAAPPPPPVMPAPLPGMPVTPPSPDMEIRPVRWRRREAQDYYDDEDEVVDGTNGQCLTEYDVFRDYDDDDDD
jgi:hypothetical protein